MSDLVGQASRLPGSGKLTGRRDACPTWCWSIYSLLIVITAALVTSRVMSMRPPNPKSPTPFQSANDRSRWATIRALVDEGTYSLDDVIFDKQGKQIFGWYSIDLVRHRGPDGREHYYSSKPTLLPTLLAGEYWLIKQATGATLSAQPGYVARLMLLITNVILLVLALVVLARLIDGLGATDWGRIFTLACACFATFVTTFSVTLNNHSLAAITTVFGIAALIPIWQGRGQWWHLSLAGLFLSLTAANELPALSLLVFAIAGLIWKVPRMAIVLVPPLVLVASGALCTNDNAHRSWSTPYAHRQDGWKVASLPLSRRSDLNAGGLWRDLPHDDNDLQGVEYLLGQRLTTDAEIIPKKPGQRWELWNPSTHLRFALVATGDRIEVREWDNWYDYPGTHWDPATITGIDRGEPSPLVYAFHCLVGHHGLFSLTPIWLFSVAGCWFWIRNGDETKRALALTTIVITLVVLAFYLSRPQLDRNYGGGTCCLRWLLWLTPLWLLALLPAVDRLGQSTWGRGLALAFLAISVFSAWYAADNPWSDPWIYDYWEQLGWIRY